MAVVRVRADLGSTNAQLRSVSTNVRDIGAAARIQTRAMQGLGRAIRTAGVALVTYFGVSAFAGQIRAATRATNTIDDLRIRFDTLTGSAEAGGRALEVVRQSATRLPFDLEQIATASASLIVVSENTDELNQNIQLTADLAAASGLTFQQTAEQIQRAFSSGAASADLFRERGINALVGIQSGTRVTAEETRELFRQYGESIAGVSNRINQTLTGALSQLADRVFNLRVELGRPIRSAAVIAINRLLEIVDANRETLDEVARTIGRDLVDGTLNFAESLATAIPTLRAMGQIGSAIFSVLQISILTVVNGFNALTFAMASVLDLLGLVEEGTVATARANLEASTASLAAAVGLDEEADALRRKNEQTVAALDFIQGVRDAINEQRMATEADTQATENNTAAQFRRAQALRDQRMNQDLYISSIGDTGRALQTLAGENASAFRLAQNVQVAEAIGNTYAGATRAFRDHAFPLSAAIATGVIATGLAQVAQIRSQTVPGRQFGGRVQAGQPYEVGEVGREVFVPDEPGEIIPNDQLGQGGGYTAQAFITQNFGLGRNSRVAADSANRGTIDALTQGRADGNQTRRRAR